MINNGLPKSHGCVTSVSVSTSCKTSLPRPIVCNHGALKMTFSIAFNVPELRVDGQRSHVVVWTDWMRV